MILNIKEIAEDYSKANKNIDSKAVENILLKYYEMIGDRIIEGEVYKPVNNWGVFGIIKKKTNKKSIDWNETRKTGKYVYFLNKHSDGNHFTFVWLTRKNRIENMGIANAMCYKMKPVESFKDKISARIKEGNENPFVVILI
jgi:hypothetical protein